jgi:hypothetical protein
LIYIIKKKEVSHLSYWNGQIFVKNENDAKELDSYDEALQELNIAQNRSFIDIEIVEKLP